VRRTHLYQVTSRLKVILVAGFIAVHSTVTVVLEKFEAAVDHRWVGVCLKCGAGQFEQDDERVRLVIVILSEV